MKKRIVVVICIVCVLFLAVKIFSGKSHREFLTVKEAVYSINHLYEENLTEEKQYSGKYITYGDVKRILKKLNIKNGRITSGKSDEKITRENWKKILHYMLKQQGMEETVEEKKLQIFMLADSDNEKMIVTDSGNYIYTDIEKLGMDKEIYATVRNNRIIFVSKMKKANPFYKNVFVTQKEKHKMTVSLGGVERIFHIKGISIENTNTLCDICVRRGNITKIYTKRDAISGKVLSLEPEQIEIEGYGKIQVSKTCRYVKNAGEEKMELGDGSILKVGDENLHFVVADKKICAVMKTKEKSEQPEKTVRVLIKSTGFKDLFHDSVKVSCEGAYTLSYYTKNQKGDLESHLVEQQAGTQNEILPDNEMLKDGRIRISPADKNQKISLSSITRNGEVPSYRGEIEVSNYEGRLVVINELPIEEYLYAVVPSEMPSSYGVEALKVQAVCARSYVVSHLGDQTLSVYGAQVDDSTDYQVYNNSGESDVAIQAVSDTKGEIMKSGDEIVNAYFFATSCGSTTSARIWGGEGKPYVKEKILCKDNKGPNLSNQDEFAKFIRPDFKSFDQGTSWYRWNITFTKQQISDIVNEHLGDMCSRFPNQILVKSGDSYIKKSITTVGNVQKVTVMSRLEGGVINELIINGSDATVKVQSQSVIRNLFNPYGVDIHKNDGTVHNKMSALPSAFFDVDNKEQEITFVGGGFGHGAGMSQTAVKSMVASGMSYQDILKFFYTNIGIERY